MTEFSGRAERITTDAPYVDAAAELGCELAAIKAVAEVESAGDPFLPDGRPKILFERHIFHRKTGGEYSAEHSGVSSSSPGGYEGGAAEYSRLRAALTLDRDAALQSASWGRFQIMGFNHAVCGYAGAEAFVSAMVDSEVNHLDAFVGFVKGNRLDRALRAKDWAAFARGYNGPAYAKNKYDQKMATAYAKHSAEAATATTAFRVADVRSLQQALTWLGGDPGTPDGLMGPRTGGAIRQFETASKLPPTGAASAAVMAAVQAVYYAFDGSEEGV